MELNDEVIEQTPRLLDLSRRVAQSDAEQIEPLYQLAEKWAAQVKYCMVEIFTMLSYTILTMKLTLTSTSDANMTHFKCLLLDRETQNVNINEMSLLHCHFMVHVLQLLAH